jgi:hypothetical protein
MVHDRAIPRSGCIRALGQAGHYEDGQEEWDAESEPENVPGELLDPVESISWRCHVAIIRQHRRGQYSLVALNLALRVVVESGA